MAAILHQVARSPIITLWCNGSYFLNNHNLFNFQPIFKLFVFYKRQRCSYDTAYLWIYIKNYFWFIFSKKDMYHYQHNVTGERANCGKMAAMCGHSTLLAGNADETSSLYIYISGLNWVGKMDPAPWPGYTVSLCCLQPGLVVQLWMKACLTL